MLHLLGDEMLPAAGIKGLNGVRHLRKLADIRNQSVLALRETAVGTADCDTLRKQALEARVMERKRHLSRPQWRPGGLTGTAPMAICSAPSASSTESSGH